MRPFWQDLLLNITGPVASALVGSLVVGLWVARITANTQMRRRDESLRAELVHRLSELSWGFYLMTQHYQRHLDDLAQQTSSIDGPADQATVDLRRWIVPLSFNTAGLWANAGH
jgi:hypothetical protein